MSFSPFLSLVIPAYNEACRIGQTLHTVAEYLQVQSFVSEVIVVDDGSLDETAPIVRDFIPVFAQSNLTLQLVTNPGGNQGKGFTVRHGFLKAQGEIVLFSDADLSTPISETPKLIQPIADGQYDVTFGSRALPGSLVGRHQPWLRETAGRTFNLVMQKLVGLPFADTQCGFKAFRRQLLRPVFEQQQIFGFGFDVEVLYLANKRRARLCEIPVIWNDVDGSKVSLLRGAKAFGDLLVIRYRDARGKYQFETDEPDPAGCENGEKSVA